MGKAIVGRKFDNFDIDIVVVFTNSFSLLTPSYIIVKNEKKIIYSYSIILV